VVRDLKTIAFHTHTDHTAVVVPDVANAHSNRILAMPFPPIFLSGNGIVWCRSLFGAKDRIEKSIGYTEGIISRVVSIDATVSLANHAHTYSFAVESPTVDKILSASDGPTGDLCPAGGTTIVVLLALLVELPEFLAFARVVLKKLFDQLLPG
jgi:hypothetical protein